MDVAVGVIEENRVVNGNREIWIDSAIFRRGVLCECWIVDDGGIVVVIVWIDCTAFFFSVVAKKDGVVDEEVTSVVNGPAISCGEIAYELGFDNPPYFTRFFKKRVGETPSDFISMN